MKDDFAQRKVVHRGMQNTLVSKRVDISKAQNMLWERRTKEIECREQFSGVETEGLEAKSKIVYSYTLERRWPEKAAGGMAFFLNFTLVTFFFQEKESNK